MFYHDQQRLHRQIRFHQNSRWYTIAMSLHRLPEETHSQRKYRRIMFDINPFLLRDSFWSSLIYLRLESREIVFIPLEIPRKWITRITRTPPSLFIYFFFRSFDNRRRWIHKIREYSRGKLLSLMLMFYAWQFDDTWPRVSIIWARISTYGGSSKRRGTLDGNIFRQHHRGIVRMKFSRTDPIRLRIPG